MWVTAVHLSAKSNLVMFVLLIARERVAPTLQFRHQNMYYGTVVQILILNSKLKVPQDGE